MRQSGVRLHVPLCACMRICDCSVCVFAEAGNSQHTRAHTHKLPPAPSLSLSFPLFLPLPLHLPPLVLPPPPISLCLCMCSREYRIFHTCTYFRHHTCCARIRIFRACAQAQALEFIGVKIKPTKFGRRTSYNKVDEAREKLATVVVSHVPVVRYDFRPKAIYIALMVRRIIQVCICACACMHAHAHAQRRPRTRPCACADHAQGTYRA